MEQKEFSANCLDAYNKHSDSVFFISTPGVLDICKFHKMSQKQIGSSTKLINSINMSNISKVGLKCWSLRLRYGDILGPKTLLTF